MKCRQIVKALHGRSKMPNYYAPTVQAIAFTGFSTDILSPEVYRPSSAHHAANVFTTEILMTIVPHSLDN